MNGPWALGHTSGAENEGWLAKAYREMHTLEGTGRAAPFPHREGTAVSLSLFPQDGQESGVVQPSGEKSDDN